MHQFITILGASINLLNCRGCVLCIIENSDNNAGLGRKRLNVSLWIKTTASTSTYIHSQFFFYRHVLCRNLALTIVIIKPKNSIGWNVLHFQLFTIFLLLFLLFKKQEFYKWQSSHNVLLKTGNVHRVEWDERSAKVIVVLRNQPAFWKRQRLTYSFLLKNLSESFSQLPSAKVIVDSLK